MQATLAFTTGRNTAQRDVSFNFFVRSKATIPAINSTKTMKRLIRSDFEVYPNGDWVITISWNVVYTEMKGRFGRI
jgi:hypothetical protein